jgi:protein gp37
MGRTIISWATYTNNVVHGCSKPIEVDAITQKRFVSPECVHCYAENLSLKRGWTQKPWTEPNEESNVSLHPERFKNFRVAVKPKHLPPSMRERFFVCSMGDIFHRCVPDSFLQDLFTWLVKYPHIYQLVTKRPERAADWPGPWPPHIWLGTTCGTVRTKHRIDHLRRSGAQVRFISAEPLLDDLAAELDLSGIHQVIVGGESGSGYRPMSMQWARNIKNLCVEKQVAFFYKQDAAFRTEERCYLVEDDRTCWQWRQFPGELTPPVQVEPDSAKKHAELFPVLRG